MDNVHGGDIYSYGDALDFSANINPLPMPPEIAAAVRRSVGQLRHYPDPSCRGLRRALSAYHGLPENFFICGNGAAELLFTLVFAYRPKAALTAAPSFLEYEAALRAVGADVRRFLLSEKDGFMPPDSFLDALDETLDMAFLCVPNNPTGVLPPRDFVSAVADRCRARRILLVLDECFLDFLPRREQASFLEETKHNEYLAVLRSFTKMYALAGLRLGYAVTGNQRLLARMYACRQPWPVSVPAEAAGIAALKETAFAERSRQYIHKEAAYLTRELGALVQKVYAPAANFIFFQDKGGLWEQCLARGILIRDCSNYAGLESGYYRVAVKLHEENERLVRTLAAVKDNG